MDTETSEYAVLAGAGFVAGVALSAAINALAKRRSSSPGATGSSTTPSQPANDLEPLFWRNWRGSAASRPIGAAFVASNWRRLTNAQKTSAIFGAFSPQGWARSSGEAIDAQAVAMFDRVRAGISSTGPANTAGDPSMQASARVVTAIDTLS